MNSSTLLRIGYSVQMIVKTFVSRLAMIFGGITIASIAIMLLIKIFKINEWLDDNFRGTNVKTHWMAKFKRNSDRMQLRFNICGTYDDRRRRDTESGDAIVTTPDTAYDYDYDYEYDESSDEVLDFSWYDKTNPINGLRQITVVFKNEHSDLFQNANFNQENKS